MSDHIEHFMEMRDWDVVSESTLPEDYREFVDENLDSIQAVNQFEIAKSCGFSYFFAVVVVARCCCCSLLLFVSCCLLMCCCVSCCCCCCCCCCCGL